MADLLPAPAALVRRLADHEGGRDAGGAFGRLRRLVCCCTKAAALWSGMRVGRSRRQRRQRRRRRGRDRPRRHAHLPLELARDRLGQAAGQAGHLRRELLVEHLGAELAAFVVEHARGQRRLAHALHQLLHEQRLELLGDLAHRGLRVARGARCAARPATARRRPAQARLGGVVRLAIRSPRSRRAARRRSSSPAGSPAGPAASRRARSAP